MSNPRRASVAAKSSIRLHGIQAGLWSLMLGLFMAAGCTKAEDADSIAENAPGDPSIDAPDKKTSAAKSSTEISAALDWLVRHQHPDGYWASNEVYAGRCEDPNAYAEDIAGAPGYDVGVTALSMLALSRAGHTHSSTANAEYAMAQKKALDWLLGQQLESEEVRKNGTFGMYTADGKFEEGRVYNHAIATLAVTELLERTGDELRLRKPLERAVRYCLDAQTPGLGWRYEYQSPKCDTSVTGWMTLALLQVQECANKDLCTVDAQKLSGSIRGALQWFDLVTTRTDWRAGYTGPGDPGANWMSHGEPYPYSKELSSMTAVSVSCQLEESEARGESEIVQGGVNLLMKNPPSWEAREGNQRSTINHYYWYHGSTAISKVGGESWRSWRDALTDSLIPNQARLADKEGSWAPVGEWGAAGGRTYSTAISALALEVGDTGR